MSTSPEARVEEAQRLPHEEIARRLDAHGVPIKKDTAIRNNVGYMAKVVDEYGTYWQIARNVYIRMVLDGTI